LIEISRLSWRSAPETTRKHDNSDAASRVKNSRLCVLLTRKRPGRHSKPQAHSTSSRPHLRASKPSYGQHRLAPIVCRSIFRGSSLARRRAGWWEGNSGDPRPPLSCLHAPAVIRFSNPPDKSPLIYLIPRASWDEQLPRTLFNSLGSDDVVRTRRLQGLVSGMAHENCYTARPDRLLASPATKHPADRI
jgi:hypothetical protein